MTPLRSTTGADALSTRYPFLLIVLLSATVLPSCGTEPATFDREDLERAEELSEALANDLLGLSVAVRERNLDAVARYLDESLVATPLPRAPGTPERVVKWIQRRRWDLASNASATRRERAQFLDELRDFLGRFEEIDDARFKVKQATFAPDGVGGEAHLAFYLVGRTESGWREWLRGTAHVEVSHSGADPWKIGAFHLESLESLSSEADLFSEIALPAGVAALFSPFGVGRNQGFVAHGAAAADVDLDGLVDLAATGVDQNYLYVNDGTGSFRDASTSSGVKFTPPGSGALFLDYDNDGDPDLFLAAVGEQMLLENRFLPDGKVMFRDVSAAAGVARAAVGFSAVAADANGDGWTDVYVCSYNRYGSVMPNSWLRATNGTPNLLFLNRGDGTFAEVAASWAVDDRRWSYAAGFVDLDGDGDQDLYVANDFGEDGLYRNDGGRFTDIASEMGVQDPGFGMGVSFGDYDNDGDLDLHVTNMSSTAGKRILGRLYPQGHEIGQVLLKQAAGNSLYQNLGGGRFREVTQEVGGLAGGWAFGGGFLDFDNDGWVDLYTPNGFVSGKTMHDT